MTHDTGHAAQRLADALTDPARLFERKQLAYLMSTAMRWGYELAMAEMEPDALSWHAGRLDGYRARVAEENAAYPPEPYHLTTSAREDSRRVHRSRIGIDEVAPRSGDWPGGTAAEALAAFGWEADRPEPAVDRTRLRVVRQGRTFVWAEGGN